MARVLPPITQLLINPLYCKHITATGRVNVVTGYLSISLIKMNHDKNRSNRGRVNVVTGHVSISLIKMNHDKNRSNRGRVNVVTGHLSISLIKMNHDKNRSYRGRVNVVTGHLSISLIKMNHDKNRVESPLTIQPLCHPCGATTVSHTALWCYYCVPYSPVALLLCPIQPCGNTVCSVAALHQCK
ncbi:hypothetical protein J6590_048753 [Homalodisca vitripennis]|nr:hypothetical protein J6590_048753 [Homalodisca vitripennis]